jgi:hypothetical protein
MWCPRSRSGDKAVAEGDLQHSEPSSGIAGPVMSTEAEDSSHSKAKADVDWTSLVVQVVHPLKVAIIETLRWMDEPLSRADLGELLADAGYDPEAIRYHADALIELQMLEAVTEGMAKRYYCLRR